MGEGRAVRLHKGCFTSLQVCFCTITDEARANIRDGQRPKVSRRATHVGNARLSNDLVTVSKIRSVLKFKLGIGLN